MILVNKALFGHSLACVYFCSSVLQVRPFATDFICLVDILVIFQLSLKRHLLHMFLIFRMNEIA